MEDGESLGSAHILDCYIRGATYHCAALAAGAAADVATAVARGQAPGGAAIIRPPGHHAEGGLAMGFCFFNNAAVAARWVREDRERAAGGRVAEVRIDSSRHCCCCSSQHGTSADMCDHPTLYTSNIDIVYIQHTHSSGHHHW
jgi:hypothetical protein